MENRIHNHANRPARPPSRLSNFMKQAQKTKKKLSPAKKIPKNMQPTLERRYFEQCKKFTHRMITFQPCLRLKFAVSALMLMVITCLTM